MVCLPDWDCLDFVLADQDGAHVYRQRHPPGEGYSGRAFADGLAKSNRAKFIGGLLGIGAGLSLGREGPSVQLGAAAGQGISRLLRRPSMEEKYLLTSGAAQGCLQHLTPLWPGWCLPWRNCIKIFPRWCWPLPWPLRLLRMLSPAIFCGQGPVFDFHNIPLMPFHYYLYVVDFGSVSRSFRGIIQLEPG